MTETSEAEVTTKAQVFGAVRFLPVTGGLPPPVAKLREPLPEGDYGAYVFCSGCGLVHPVLTSAIADIIGQQPGDLGGMYIQVERCEFDGSDRLVGAKLVRIPMDS